MLKRLKNIFLKDTHVGIVANKNRLRFESIISDKSQNHLKRVYERLFKGDTTLSEAEILGAYYKFSDKIQTNTFAAAELELVTISVLCHFRPNLTATLVKRGLFSIVYSLGDNIDWFTVGQFIERRILIDDIEPYGGLPPEVGINWLKNLLPERKELIQNVLEEVIRENRIEIDKI